MKRVLSKDVIPNTVIPGPLYYYLGSHEGCGCGFSFEGIPETDEDFSKRKSNYADLQAYLISNGIEEGAEMFFCWIGDEKENPDRTVDLRLSDLQTLESGFEEKVRYRLVREN